MTFISKLSITSFRKFELNLLLKFFLRVKKIFIANLLAELIICKFNILLKLTLYLPLNTIAIKYINKHVLNSCLSSNYFYLDCDYSLTFIPISYLYSYFPTKYSSTYNKLLSHFIYLNFSLKVLSKIKLNSFSSMPTKRKLFTVLRSPHTDKKSREQFTLKRYRKVLSDSFGFYTFINTFTSIFEIRTCQLKYKKYSYLQY